MLQNLASKLSKLCSRCQYLDHKGKYGTIKIYENIIVDMSTKFLIFKVAEQTISLIWCILDVFIVIVLVIAVHLHCN